MTFHTAFNSGAMLQAYALCTKLREMGVQAEILDIGGRHGEVGAFPACNNLKQMLSFPIKFLNMLGVSQLRAHRFHRFRDCRLKPMPMDLSGQDLEKTLDVIIVGSDQVWSPFLLRETLPCYLLTQVTDEVRKVSYAASFGAECIPEDMRALYQESLRRFSYITVREDAGRRIVEDLIGLSPDVVLDPTLLLKDSDYDAVAVKRLVKGDYVCMYSPCDDEPLYRLAKRVARLNGMRLVSIQNGRSGYAGSHLTDWRATSPDRFLSLIKHANCVVTDSFHGTVFSILYHKPYVIRQMNGSKANSRFETLLGALSLQDRVIDDGISDRLLVDKLSVGDLDVDERLDTLRQKSVKALEKIVSIGE